MSSEVESSTTPAQTQSAESSISLSSSMMASASATPADETNGNVATAEEEKSSPSPELRSPLKAAADLIQSLDMAYNEMTHQAADAARDAETARRNARAASEIARRYLHRSYPKVQSPFGAGTTSTTSSPSSRLQSYQNERLATETKSNEDDALLNISGIATSLHTPRDGVISSGNNSSNNSSNNNNSTKMAMSPSRSNRGGGFSTTSASERIAQAHAEDILGLTMEVEKSKQALKAESRAHEDTKASMAAFRSKNKSLEQENKKLAAELESSKDEAESRIKELEDELGQSHFRVEAAEEDAQLALDLAKDSAQKRDELEVALQDALDQIRALQEEKRKGWKNPETPQRSVRFADMAPEAPTAPTPIETPTVATPSSGSGHSRSMVAAGRQLLRRSKASPDEEVIQLELTPAKSAERRRRLRERLSQLDDDLTSPTQKSPQRQDGSGKNPSLSSNIKLVDECKASTKILQESGQRLGLSGHWWKDLSNQLLQEIRLEAMTRQYCQSVEFKIERQRKEISELESLCGFLENKLVLGTD